MDRTRHHSNWIRTREASSRNPSPHIRTGRTVRRMGAHLPLGIGHDPSSSAGHVRQARVRGSPSNSSRLREPRGRKPTATCRPRGSTDGADGTTPPLPVTDPKYHPRPQGKVNFRTDHSDASSHGTERCNSFPFHHCFREDRRRAQVSRCPTQDVTGTVPQGRAIDQGVATSRVSPSQRRQPGTGTAHLDVHKTEMAHTGGPWLGRQ